MGITIRSAITSQPCRSHELCRTIATYDDAAGGFTEWEGSRPFTTGPKSLRFQVGNPKTVNCSLAWSLAPVETPQRLFRTVTGAVT